MEPEGEDPREDWLVVAGEQCTQQGRREEMTSWGQCGCNGTVSGSRGCGVWGLPWEGVRRPESLRGPCSRVVVFNTAVLGLHCCVRAFSGGGELGYSSCTAVASLVEERGL